MFSSGLQVDVQEFAYLEQNAQVCAHSFILFFSRHCCFWFICDIHACL